MNSLYEAPKSEITYDIDVKEVTRRRRFWKRAIWILIACVIIPPVIGLAGTIIGLAGTIIEMVEAFSELADTGQADPEVLAEHISTSLLTTLWGLGFWGLGFSAIAFIALIGVLIRFFTLPKLPVSTDSV